MTTQTSTDGSVCTCGSLLSCSVPANALDDAIQDVFLVLFRRADDFDPAWGTVRAWLFGICLRVAHKHRSLKP